MHKDKITFLKMQFQNFQKSVLIDETGPKKKRNWRKMLNKVIQGQRSQKKQNMNNFCICNDEDAGCAIEKPEFDRRADWACPLVDCLAWSNPMRRSGRRRIR